MPEDMYAFQYRGRALSIVYRFDDDGYYAGWDIIYQGWALSRLSEDEQQELGFLPADMAILNDVADAYMRAKVEVAGTNPNPPAPPAPPHVPTPDEIEAQQEQAWLAAHGQDSP